MKRIASCTFLLFFATHSHAALMLDFNYLANNLPNGLYFGVNPINTHGFTISASGNGAFGLGVYGANSSYQADPGHAAVAVNLPGAITSFVRTDNALFDFNSIDLADYYNDGAGGTIRFTFFDQSNNNTFQDVALDTLPGLQTITFNIGDLSKVSWQTVDGSFGMSQFDNILVDSPVPEPSSLFTGVLGLGLAVARRRR